MPTKLIYDAVVERLGVWSKEEDRAVEDLILWKAGFNVPRYDAFLASFRSALVDFNEVLIATPASTTEADRKAVRASAVNTFVYAERFIEELISFNVWYLTSDHFGDEQFTYNAKASLKAVSRLCGRQIDAGGASFSWNDAGGNTLGTLLVYGRRSADMVKELRGSDKTAFRRPENQFPHFASPTNRRFPFKHTELWADADAACLEEFCDRFDGAIKLLESARLAEMRNGVQHYRDARKFPKIDVLAECVSVITKCLDLADVANLLPKTFWVSESLKNEYGISRWRLRDYNGRTMSVTSPYALIGLKVPSFDTPLIIACGSILGQNAPKIVMEHREDSVFHDRWMNYPMRIQQVGGGSKEPSSTVVSLSAG